jgi:hypothetical protein
MVDLSLLLPRIGGESSCRQWGLTEGDDADRVGWLLRRHLLAGLCASLFAYAPCVMEEAVREGSWG